jgi:hypothetical protein
LDSKRFKRHAEPRRSIRNRPFVALLGTLAVAAAAVLGAEGSFAAGGSTQQPPKMSKQALASLAKKKAREHHRAIAVPAGDRYYPDLGILIAPPPSGVTPALSIRKAKASRVGHAAAAGGGLATIAEAVADFKNQPQAAILAGGKDKLQAVTPAAEFRAVTETDPVDPAVTKGTAYSAWVVTTTHVPAFSAGGNPLAAASSAPSGLLCDAVGIYDLQLLHWTEFVQTNCH